MESSSRFALHSPRVLLRQDDGRLLTRPATILIAHGRIEAVHEGEVPPPLPPEWPLERCSELVTPAFVDAHTHLALSVLRGLTMEALGGNVVEDLFYRVESHLEPGDVRAFSRMGAWECLSQGTGCVWDHYYGGLEVAEALRDTGLAGVVAPTLQDLAGPGVPARETQWDATLAIHEDRSFAEAGIHAAFGPHATDTVSGELFDQIAVAAERFAIPVHLHLAQTHAEWARSMARHRVSPAQFLDGTGVLAAAPRTLGVHGIFLTDADLALLAARRVTLGFCPSSQQQFAFPAAVGRWSEAGVPWYAGTDCTPSNDSFSVQKELRAVFGWPLLQVSMSEACGAFQRDGEAKQAAQLESDRARAIATTSLPRSGAALLERVWDLPGAIHPRFHAGRITAGAAAHLAFWDWEAPAFWPGLDFPRTLALGDTASALTRLLVQGRWHRAPAALREDPAYREAAREATDRRRRLFRRAGLPEL